MDNAFLRSIFVQPRIVIGRELRHFSCYHLAALMLLDSPFLEARPTATKDDLVLAVFVCSYGFEDGPQKLFPDPDLREVLDWAHVFDFHGELEKFEQYLDDYLKLPEIWDSSRNAGKSSGIPSPFYVAAAVLQFVNGITEAQAWNMPFPRAVGYKCAAAEQHGWDVVSEKVDRVLQYVEEETKGPEDNEDRKEA